MKNPLLALGITTLLICIVLISGCLSPSDFKTYNANGITFSYPPDWNINNTNNTLTGFTVIANVENSTTKKYAYFKVSKTKITPNMTLQGTYNTLLSSIKQNPSNKDIKYENFPVAGKQAKLIEFNSYNSTINTKNEYTLFEKKGNIYLTQYTESPYNSYDVGFSILNTLRMTDTSLLYNYYINFILRLPRTSS